MSVGCISFQCCGCCFVKCNNTKKVVCKVFLNSRNGMFVDNEHLSKSFSCLSHSVETFPFYTSLAPSLCSLQTSCHYDFCFTYSYILLSTLSQCVPFNSCHSLFVCDISVCAGSGCVSIGMAFFIILCEMFELWVFTLAITFTIRIFY